MLPTLVYYLREVDSMRLVSKETDLIIRQSLCENPHLKSDSQKKRRLLAVIHNRDEKNIEFFGGRLFSLEVESCKHFLVQTGDSQSLSWLLERIQSINVKTIRFAVSHSLACLDVIKNHIKLTDKLYDLDQFLMLLKIVAEEALDTNQFPLFKSTIEESEGRITNGSIKKSFNADLFVGVCQ